MNFRIRRYNIFTKEAGMLQISLKLRLHWRNEAAKMRLRFRQFLSSIWFFFVISFRQRIVFSLEIIDLAVTAKQNLSHPKKRTAIWLLPQSWVKKCKPLFDTSPRYLQLENYHLIIQRTNSFSCFAFCFLQKPTHLLMKLIGTTKVLQVRLDFITYCVTSQHWMVTAVNETVLFSSGLRNY